MPVKEMLHKKERRELEVLRRSWKLKRRRTRAVNRAYYSTARRLVRLYGKVVVRLYKQDLEPRGMHFRRLHKLAGEAIEALGGQAEPSPTSLRQYDHNRYGPFLGVSDEGSAAAAIRRAALCSPKMRALGWRDPIVVGVALDAERLGAAGEVAVGPAEYKAIWLECVGRIPTSTNVGTRLNLRFYKRRPVVYIRPGQNTSEVIREAMPDLRTKFAPFWHTPDKRPRPLTVFIQFNGAISTPQRFRMLRELVTKVKKGSICDPKQHNLGLLERVTRGQAGVKQAKSAINLAKRANLEEVAIEGVVRKRAEDKISMPGLLNYFNAIQTRELLKYATKKNVRIQPKNLVDTETVARSVWADLLSARNMGLHLGKYGLFPLTLEEMGQVMGRVQSWFPEWTTAPVFYVDFPLVDSNQVYTQSNITAAILKWLEVVSTNHIPVVLIDTADKGRGTKLLKQRPGDRKGVLRLEQIAQIQELALDLGVRILWAGGLDMSQLFELGGLGVFGAYVTSATTVEQPVSGSYALDPMLAAVKEPTKHGVLRAKIILEAGFLGGRLRSHRPTLAEDIEARTWRLLGILAGNKKAGAARQEQCRLEALLVKGWRVHLKSIEKR